jgi:outer membrane protein assembly factor BamB
VTTGQGQTGLALSEQPYAQAFAALDADTLQPLEALQPMSAPFVADYDFGGSPTLVDVPDGRRLVVAANKDGYVYAAQRDRLSAGVAWLYQVSVGGEAPDLGDGTIVGSAYAHGTVFVGGGQTRDGFPGAVAALDPASGAPRWVFHPEGFVLASLLAVGDVVVAQANHLADHTGRLYALDQATGAIVFQLSTPGPLYAQATYAEGKLFVSDASGIVYALMATGP